VSRELYLQGMGGDRGDPAVEALVATLDRENAALQERIVELTTEVARLRAAAPGGDPGEADALRARLSALSGRLEDLERARAEQAARAARAEEQLAVERRRADGLRSTIRLISRAARSGASTGPPAPTLSSEALRAERLRHAITRRKLEHVTAHLVALRSGRAYRLLSVVWRLQAMGRRRRP
jgi:hypothetical protein